MSQHSDGVVVPFAAFLEARERRRRVAAAFKEPALEQYPDDRGSAAAAAVAVAREAVSAVTPRGFHDDSER